MPHPAPHWRFIETHISLILLTGHWAYKFKKPVSFGFLDYSTLELRKQSCERELEINNRYSHQIYDSLWCVIRDVAGNLSLRPADDSKEEKSTVVEYAVRMRQFPADSLLSEQLSAGMSVDRMDELADQLVQWHQRLPRAEWSEDEFPELTRRWALENFDYCQSNLKHPAQLDSYLEWTRRYQAELEERCCQRLRTGFVRQCHGDLHLENVLWLDQEFQLFDGIEFNRELSDIDVANDLAFLLMELSEHGYRSHARRLLNRYLELSEDYGSLFVLRYYLVYRAMVRAKVDLIRQVQEAGTPAEFSTVGRAYLDFARRIVDGNTPVVYLMHGLSGSGKSTVALKMVETMGVIRLRSDWVRKRLAGMEDPNQKTESSKLSEMYSGEMGAKTYGWLLQRTAEILKAGYSVAVDATFLKKDQRQPFLRQAQQMGVECRIVACEASPEVLQKRLGQRQDDPSDATTAVVDRQREEMEAWLPQEESLVISADSI